MKPPQWHSIAQTMLGLSLVQAQKYRHPAASKDLKLVSGRHSAASEYLRFVPGRKPAASKYLKLGWQV